MNISVAKSFYMAMYISWTTGCVCPESVRIIKFALSYEYQMKATCYGRRRGSRSRAELEDFRPMARQPLPSLPAGARGPHGGPGRPALGSAGVGGKGHQVGRCSQAGQVEVVLDPVLQRSQLGHLLQLLLAGSAGWHAAEEALQVVGQGL